MIKGMGAVVLLALLLSPAISAAAERHWAVWGARWQMARPLTGSVPQFYGAAWNYPTVREANEAARAACDKEVRSSARWKPTYRDTGCRQHADSKGAPDTCFVVLRQRRTYGSGTEAFDTVTVFWGVGPFKDIAAARRGATEALADKPPTGPEPNWVRYLSEGIDLIKCAGR